MRKLNVIAVIVTVFLAGLSGCESTKSKLNDLFTNKPVLELTGENPYNLIISEFAWSYGLVSINQYSGDFEKLDKKVFEKLNGKQGKCSVYLSTSVKDQYGKGKVTSEYIGDIELSDLNQYESWEYWHKSSGIISLLNHKYLKNNNSLSYSSNSPDMTGKIEGLEAMRTSISSQKSQPIAKVIESNGKTFSVTHEDLYPSQSERESHDFQSYTQPIKGIIQYADFYNGFLEVQGDDGQLHALRLLSDELPTSLKSDVRYFMKAGNRISCICTVAGARELIITSATFISGK